MRNIIIVVSIVIVLAGAVIYRSLSAPTPSPQQVASVMQLSSNTKVYDVRTPEEYATSHVKDATLFPVTDMQAGTFPEIPKNTSIALYCRSGNRSSEATKLLKQAGFTSITDLGGLNNLAKFGLKAE